MWQEEQRLSRFDDGAVRMRRQNEAVHSNIAAARAQDVVRSRVDALASARFAAVKASWLNQMKHPRNVDCLRDRGTSRISF